MGEASGSGLGRPDFGNAGVLSCGIASIITKSAVTSIEVFVWDPWILCADMSATGNIKTSKMTTDGCVACRVSNGRYQRHLSQRSNKLTS